MRHFSKISTLICMLLLLSANAFAQSIREERRLIMDGNKLYSERKFKEADSKYKAALEVNPMSAVAKYNLGLSQIKQVVNPKDTTQKVVSLLDNAVKSLTEIAAMAKDKPGLASKANYNLGNLAFNREDFKSAIDFYKQALRIDPSDNNAKKNLRIAQLKQQNQNQENKQDKNENKENDQNKDQQDQNKDQQNSDNKDQKQDQNDQNKEQPDKQNIDQQTASQILQAIDNKESQTRAKVNKANSGEKAVAAGRRSKRW